MMIAFDTNALIRMLVEDDPDQAKLINDLVIQVETDSGQILSRDFLVTPFFLKQPQPTQPLPTAKS